MTATKTPRSKAIAAEIDALMEAWASGSFSRETYDRLEELRSAYKQCLVDERLAEGNVESALCLFGSEEIAGAIVRLAPALDDDRLRDILRDEWTRCEAHREYRADFVELFRRTEFITDTDDVPAAVLSGTATIYRGNLGEEEPVGISWALNEKQARWFANAPMSVRGMFLGMYREDGQPTVWRASVPAKEILGYFDGRSEQEVVVDPATLTNVSVVAQATPGGKVEV